ncbi:serine hydrolase domain-containing protein [Labrys neptuniae]
MRRLPILAALIACIVGPSAPVQAEPGRHWQAVPNESGWTADTAKAVTAYAGTYRPTALAVIRDDRIVASAGDPSRRVNVASVRKSLLSALYGIAIGENRIALGDSLEKLGIDDIPPALTADEKQADVRDLLMARSGVYHPAAYETADIRNKRPARGSHPHGTFWFYNNWDFNVLGTIYRQASGEDIFTSFEKRIAHPIGMEDFSARDGRYVLSPLSRHPAYPFRMSARDLARFGLLFLNQGRWNGRQIVPATWVRQSTAAYSPIPKRKSAYGYLWWSLPAETWGEGAAMAAGYGGQFLAYIPTKRLVMVQTVDPAQNPAGIHMRDFMALMQQIATAAP